MIKLTTLCVAAAFALCASIAKAEDVAPFSDSFTLSASFIDFLEANPGSGLTRNAWGNTAQLQLGADVDLDRLLGWQGGTLHVRESIFGLRRNGVFSPQTGGHFWAQDVGSTLGGAPFPNFIPDAYLSELSLEQRLGPVTVQGGRMNPVNYFDVPTNCEAALSCQNPITLYDNMTLPPAFATWGGRIEYAFGKTDSAQIGIFEDNFGSNVTSGFDWSTKEASGVFLAGEYSHHETFSDARYPLSATLGVFHDTSTFTDPETGRQEVGSTGFYWRFKATPWRDDDGISESAPAQYVTAFATGGLSLDDAQPYGFYSEIGANAHGFFGMSPNDFIGLKLAYLRVNDNQLQAERDRRIAAGGDDFISDSNQFRLEANAHFELPANVTLEPSVQYVWNPNSQFSAGASTARTPKDGFIFGLVLRTHFSTK